MYRTPPLWSWLIACWHYRRAVKELSFSQRELFYSFIGSYTGVAWPDAFLMITHQLVRHTRRFVIESRR